MIADHHGHQFIVLEGSLHPAYSLDCFTADEKPFREKYWQIERGDVVVDAGASYGAYTLSAVANGAKKVYAFEPEPAVYVDLMRNIDENRWNKYIEAECKGLWDSEETVDAKRYATHWPAQTITTDYDVVALDEYLGPDVRVDWVKIDVEGAESLALLGMKETLAHCKPRMIVEVHTFLNDSLLPFCRRFLERLGYNLEEVPRDPCVMLVGKCIQS